MPIYMNYPGAKGDVSSVDHTGWVEILEMNFDITKKDKKRGSAGADNPLGGGGGDAWLLDGEPF